VTKFGCEDSDSRNRISKMNPKLHAVFGGQRLESLRKLAAWDGESAKIPLHPSKEYMGFDISVLVEIEDVAAGLVDETGDVGH